MISAKEAVERLRAGNRRFVSGQHTRSPGPCPELAGGQTPFAVVLGCSDSRVPPEIVFDQNPGDLFVIRVAGNIAAPSQIGSAEFAVNVLGARLVVVLGHSRCGAVAATLQHMSRPDENHSKHLLSLIDRIRPGLKNLEGESSPTEDNLRKAIRANTGASVNQLQAELASTPSDDLQIIGAEYALETGQVDFLD